MTEPAFTFTFHDTAHDLHGTVRSGMTLLFERRAAGDARRRRPSSTATHAAVGDRIALDFDAVSDDGRPGRHDRPRRARARPGRRTGASSAWASSARPTRPPAWSEVDARPHAGLRVRARAGRAGAGAPPARGARPRRRARRRLARARRLAAGRRGHADLDRLRRRGAPAQRGDRALAARRGLPAPGLGHGASGSVADARRACASTPPCSGGGWRAATASGPTTSSSATSRTPPRDQRVRLRLRRAS